MNTSEKMKSIVQNEMKRKGIKQKYIASICGYNEKTFSALLNGHKTITDEDIVKFCDGLGVTPNDVIDHGERSAS